ncbi:MAG TPA: SDR family NAD(P)-dependent oxidoreductase [Polyangia bacterium]|nr:SDR family NAD(P)-dependent oxidoreductase [Polyangia bacterium]
MAKTILVSGYGPGISTAVAERFGAEGFAVALAARNAERLAAGVKALEAKGIRAAAFPTDVSDPTAARALVGKVRAALGPLTAIEWTAYSGAAGDLLAAEVADVRTALDVAVTSLLAVVREALPDLKTQKDAAVLVVNGGLGYFDPQVDAMAVQWGSMGLAVANAAKHKLVGLLSQKLKADGVYVGEAMVLGLVKGTAFDTGNATIDPKTVAGKLWDLYRARDRVTAEIGS